MGVGGQRHVPAALPPRKTRFPLNRNSCGKSRSPPGFDEDDDDDTDSNIIYVNNSKVTITESKKT